MSQLKEQNGKYYQQCKVVMLATNYGKLTLYDYKELKTLSYALGNHKGSTNLIPQHLYITSNEEIKKGDWFISAGKIHQYKGDKLPLIVKCDFRKIIATTDTSLYIHQKETVSLPERVFYLPPPSQQFIEKYIEEYNKGNIISDVLVEYNDTSKNEFPAFGSPVWLKINPKDNTITIKKVKDSWNKEEVSNLIKSFANNYQYASNDIGYNKWIEENL